MLDINFWFSTAKFILCCVLQFQLEVDSLLERENNEHDKSKYICIAVDYIYKLTVLVRYIYVYMCAFICVERTVILKARCNFLFPKSSCK